MIFKIETQHHLQFGQEVIVSRWYSNDLDWRFSLGEHFNLKMRRKKNVNKTENKNVHNNLSCQGIWNLNILSDPLKDTKRGIYVGSR